MYEALSLEIKTFLPHISKEELQICDANEICRLTAQARFVQKLWVNVNAEAISIALGGKKG